MSVNLGKFKGSWQRFTLTTALWAVLIAPEGALGQVAKRSGEVEVASAKGERTVLRLPSAAAHWEEPEVVRGLVNTLGWEDSVEISPSGNWLIVGTYSPVGLLCCLLGDFLNDFSGDAELCPGTKKNNDPSSQSCNHSRGPWREPERPGMLGADRIISATQIRQEVDALNFKQGFWWFQRFAVPPVAAYGFRQAADGSFQSPFVIGYDLDGFTYAPAGIRVLSESSGGAAEFMYFSSNPVDDGREKSGTDIYVANAVLGRPISLGYVAPDKDGTRQLVLRSGRRIAVGDNSGGQGNPHYDGGRLWFDDESIPEKDLYFAEPSSLAGASGSPGLAFRAGKKVGLSKSGVEETQPFFHRNRLYFRRGTDIVSSELRGADPERPESWGPIELELAAEGYAALTVEGAIFTVGEPSISVSSSGEDWMYFVYGLRRKEGLDLNVARVRRKGR